MDIQKYNSVVVGQTAPDITKSDNSTPDLVKVITRLFDTAKKARSKFDKDWDKRMDYYKGNQNNGKPVMNIIRSTIQSMLPLLTDAKPGVNIVPAEPNDYKFTKLLQKLVEYWWDKPSNSMQHTLLEIIMDQSIYDAGIAKVFFDVDVNDIVVKSINPKNIFVNKEAVDFDKDCTYVIERQYLPIAWLKCRFPEKAGMITADASKEDGSEPNPNDIEVVAPINQVQPGVLSTNNINESDCRETVEVWECWLDSTEFETTTNEDGTLSTSKKYPHGKLVTYLPNQKMVLQESKNPYKHGKKPYVRFIDTVMPHSFWGESIVESLMGNQNNVNLVLSNLLSYFKLMGNPIWFVEEGSGVDPNDITNDTALVLEVTEGKMGSVRRDIPPAMQPGIIELYSTMLRNGEIISGVNETTQGRKPVGVTAAAAIDSLQEASQTRIRLKERNMQTSLVKMGSMMVELMMQFYNTPRVIRVAGPEGQEWDDFVEFYLDETPGGYMLNKKDMKYSKEADSYIDGTYEATGPYKGIFDVRIAAGTSQPAQRAARSNIAFRLAEMNVISPKQLLKTLEFPVDPDEQAEQMNPNQPVQ